MIDYYLRTDTEAQMRAAFAAAGINILNEDGGVTDGTVTDYEGTRLDIGWLGPVTMQITTGDDPDIVEEPIVDPRFHANLRVSGELPQEVLDILPILDPPPSHPMRTWA